eukprot:g4000.t1
MKGLARKLAPLGDRVLVQRIVAEVKTASGIYLPDAAKERQNEGFVVAVGPGFKNKEGALTPPTCNVGDKVLLPEYGGTAVKLGKDEFTLFRDDDILAKFE